MKSPIYNILLSKSDFSFALLLVTFELLEIEQSYTPLLKALVCGINAVAIVPYSSENGSFASQNRNRM